MNGKAMVPPAPPAPAQVRADDSRGGLGRFPQRVVLLDPDTCVVIVGVVVSGSLQVIDSSPIDAWDPAYSPINNRGGRQRMDLALATLNDRDARHYLARALAFADQIRKDMTP